MLEEFDIAELQVGIERGELSSASLCETFLDRIDRIDRAGPSLCSVMEVNPDAVPIAERLDRERAESGARSPLHGVPVLLKDSLDTADDMMTTAGSLALVGNIAARDAFVAERLRAAGAVILGKTNMSEWGYMRSTRACSGWSSRGGQVRNPHGLDRSPSGSSSGSAVAVAAGLCTVAIGAEVDGSIVRPASINGVVGLKPTVGLVSRSGMIGVAATQDTAGPIGRSVRDVACVLNAIAGLDPRDAATHAAPTRPTDYRGALRVDALHGARIGVARDLMGTHSGVDAVIDDAIRVLADLGAEIVDPALGSAVPLFGEAELELCLYEMKAGLNRYLSEHPLSPVRSLDALIDFNRSHAERVMPFFQQELLERAVSKGGLDEPAYLDAKRECHRLARTDGIDRVLRDHRLDAIVAPTDGMPAWKIDPLCGDRIEGGCSSPAAMAGYPHISVPAGQFHGLPVALSFFADAYQEAKLLGYAHAFEQATRARRSPTFRPSIDSPA